MTAYIHHIPGRVRVRIPRIKGSEQFASELEQHLRSQRGVRTAVANPLTGNVLIHYDPTLYDPTLTDVAQFTPGPALNQRPRKKATGQGKRPDQIRSLAYAVTRMIATSLFEAAIQRAMVGVIAAVL